MHYVYRNSRRLLSSLAALNIIAMMVFIAACGNSSGGSTASNVNPDIHKIKHVVVIMQENRSFDTYFGTYPGADGYPANVCVNDPAKGQCVKPFYNPLDKNYGGPHGAANAVKDIDGGKMDGFIAQAEAGKKMVCTDPNIPSCAQAEAGVDTMGYHDARDIPNYWSYAQHYVLQDHMFEPDASWSLPEHLFMVSGWSALCSQPGNAMSCVNNIVGPVSTTQANPGKSDYAWTDLTYIMHKNNVSWGYYLANGSQPDCADDQILCQQGSQKATVPGIWNPLPNFDTVKQDNQLGNVQEVSNFFTAAKQGTLPAVSWVVPNGTISEHPPALVSIGQAYVTSLINAVMQSPDWSSTAIFLAWDDWGGFYDNVVPPVVDENGYGLRVPGLVISPYAKQGYIDHQTLSFDAYLKFIEDDFLGGQRIDPKTDGRPDPRPDVRENASQLGNLINDFDFAQTPRSPMVLTVSAALPAGILPSANGSQPLTTPILPAQLTDDDDN